MEFILCDFLYLCFGITLLLVYEQKNTTEITNN